MSWISLSRWFALASLAWLTVASAQTPQLAPPQYGISDGAPRGYTDPGPQPNLAPPQPTNDDSGEYLRLLNQRSATPNTSAVNPTSTNAAPANPAALSQVNIAARPEPQPAAPQNSPTIQATYQQPMAANGSPAAAPLNAAANNATNNNAPRAINPTGAKPLPLAGPNAKPAAASSTWGSFGTMLGSLAIVLGLFIVTIKLLRRGMPAAKQRLGRDVVEVLGQTPLAPRQTLQVIRFGNKILLVAMSPDGCDTLTEITDPLEVDRLAGMCQQSQANSSTKTFGELFRQVTSLRPAVSEPVPNEPASASTLDEVRARLRGGSIAAREVTHG